MTVVHNDICTHMGAVLKDECWFRFRFNAFVYTFSVLAETFVLLSFAFVTLGLVS